MTDILQELSAARRLDAERREAEVPFAEMVRRANAAPAPRDFAAALATSHADGRARIIAELKKASPSEGQIRAALEASELPEIAYFMEHFLPAFGMTLDELTHG